MTVMMNIIFVIDECGVKVIVSGVDDDDLDDDGDDTVGRDRI